MKKLWLRSSILPLVMLLAFMLGCGQQAGKTESEEQEEATEEQQEVKEEIPQIVMETLMATFPDAEIREWEKETEDGFVIYDIEFEQLGKKFEADIKEDGSIYNWEKEIKPEELPEAAMMAVMGKYPDAVILEIMQITEMKDGQPVLEGYEVVFETAEQEEIELTVAADGTILEDSTGQQPEEE